MKDKNLPPDNNSQSLEELTKEANNIIESLEAEKDLQNSTDSYQKLLNGECISYSPFDHFSYLSSRQNRQTR